MTKISSVYAHIHNGGVDLSVDEENGQPKVRLALSTFGHTSETSFYLDTEGLREFGFCLFRGAAHPFSSTYCVAAGVHVSGEMTVKAALQERERLLMAELDRVRTQLEDPKLDGSWSHWLTGQNRKARGLDQSSSLSPEEAEEKKEFEANLKAQAWVRSLDLD